jgi:hypothetical protein
MTSLIRCVYLCVSVATVAQAQDGYTPYCPDARVPIVDTARVVYELGSATRYNGRAYSPDQQNQILFYADAIRQHFVAPATLGFLPTLSYADSSTRGAMGRAAPASDSLDSVLNTREIARLLLVMRKNGRLKLAAWEFLPRSVELANAVYAATLAADSSLDFVGIPAPDPERKEDTLVVVIRENTTPHLPALALMRTQYPYYRSSTPAMTLTQGETVFPKAALRAGIETDGQVAFIVGTNGKAIPSSIQVIRSPWRDFVEPMRKTVETAVYQAASSNGCAVPTLVVQSFGFRINR